MASTPAPSTSTADPVPSPAPSPAAVPKVARSARGRPSDDPTTRHSKTLSYILRHGAAKESLVLRPDGFVRVVDLMKRPKLKGLDFDALEQIVKDDKKGRYLMRKEPEGDENGEWWIRANQGHSVVVESLELERVTKADEVPVVVHGTMFKLWDVIEKEGLKTMTRNHVHCAVGLSGEEGVTSGMRANCDLFIYLDVPLLLADDVPIFKSTNNVILTPGVDGTVPPKYFSKVVRKSGEVLWPLSS